MRNFMARKGRPLLGEFLQVRPLISYTIPERMEEGGGGKVRRERKEEREGRRGKQRGREKWRGGGRREERKQERERGK